MTDVRDLLPAAVRARIDAAEAAGVPLEEQAAAVVTCGICGDDFHPKTSDELLCQLCAARAATAEFERDRERLPFEAPPEREPTDEQAALFGVRYDPETDTVRIDSP